MTKLSVHVSGTNRNGFGAFLQEPFAAGSPIPLVFALNQNVWADIQKYSPVTILVYRDDRYGVDPFNDMFFSGSVERAKSKGRTWVDLYAAVWSKNPAHYYAFINEPGVHDANAYERYNAFSIGAMERAQELGYKLCLYEWSTGNPNLDLLHYLVPSLEMAKANGHLLGLHEYSLEGPMITDPPNELILRYRTLRGLLPESARCVFAITESGPGAGYGTGYRMQSYMNVVEPYDVEVMKDPCVIGVALFDYGNTESNMQEVMPLMTEYAVTHPTPEVPPEEEMLDIIVIENLVPPDTTKTEMDYVVNQTFPSRQDIQWSADTAKYLVQHALTGSKVIVWNPERWTQGDILAYLGVPTEIKYFPESDFRLANPVPSIPFRVTSLFDTPRNYANGKHEGLDLDGYDDATGKTVPVVAGADGVVVTVVDRVAPNSYGRYVVIDHKNDYRTWYCHLSSTSVSVGQSVSKGQKIGVTGATGTASIHLHLNLQHIGHGASGYFIPDAVDPLPYIDQGTVVPPTPSGKAWRGLHTRADGLDHNSSSFPLEKQVVQVAKCDAIKIMTNSTFESLDAFISQGLDPKKIVLRLFADFNGRVIVPQEFYSWQTGWLTKFASVGGLYAEIHNEQNLTQEGYGTSWKNGAEFATWYTQVVDMIKANYPTLKMVYPGLSPQVNVPEFEVTLSSLIANGKVDVVGAHSYNVNYADLNSELGGRYYRRFFKYGIPVIITEFANVGTTDSDTEKGRQYKELVSTLEKQVLGVFFFVSSASDTSFNQTRQTWIRNSKITEIPFSFSS